MTLTAGVFRPGQPGYIRPGTDEWLQCITPSKVAAILGVSRWESEYSLWHRMKGLLPPEEPKDIFQIGHDYEAAAANRYLSLTEGWKLSAGEVQVVLPARPEDGFPFPVIVTLDRQRSRGGWRGVVEFKTARHLEEWGDDFTGNCPEDYAAQVIAQMLFTGWTRHPGHLLVLGPYFNEHIYEIHYKQRVADWILAKCTTFYQSLQADVVPDLDTSVATYECVRALHPDIDGETVEVDADLGIAVHNANADLKDAETKLRGLKTRLLDQMGNAQHAILGSGEGEARTTLKVATRSPHAKGSVALNLARTHPVIQLEKIRSKSA